MTIGVHNKEQLQSLLELTPNAKILLLGYKSEVGRGVTYYGRTVEKIYKIGLCMLDPFLASVCYHLITWRLNNSNFNAFSLLQHGHVSTWVMILPHLCISMLLNNSMHQLHIL